MPEDSLVVAAGLRTGLAEDCRHLGGARCRTTLASRETARNPVASTHPLRYAAQSGVHDLAGVPAQFGSQFWLALADH